MNIKDCPVNNDEEFFELLVQRVQLQTFQISCNPTVKYADVRSRLYVRKIIVDLDYEDIHEECIIF